jgi:hypothetical protein
MFDASPCPPTPGWGWETPSPDEEAPRKITRWDETPGASRGIFMHLLLKAALNWNGFW